MLVFLCNCVIVYLLGSSRQRIRKLGRKVKFVIRRAVLGLVALPVIAGTYVFGYVVLASLANSMPLTLDEVFNNGILIGSVCAVAFAFATQLDKFSARLIGEEQA